MKKMVFTVQVLDSCLLSTSNIAIQQIIYKELNVYGSTVYADECETTLEFLRMKKVDIDKVITHRLPLEKVKEGFDLLCDKNSGAIKVILNP